MPGVLAVLPAFNEGKKLLDTVLKFPKGVVSEVLVVDDGSTDATVTEARKYGVTVISHGRRRGVGAAIRTGIDYALKKNYDIIVVMAGNGKDDPVEIPRLVQPITEEGYDYVQGSRYLKGGKWGNMPFYRILATRLYPLVWRFVTRFPATDVTNGFRAYRLALFKDKRINIWQDWLDTYELEYYLHYKVLILGYKVKEVPVSKVYPSRKRYTKISPIVGWWKILKPLFCLVLGIKR